MNFNMAHIHLLFNHVPVIGLIAGLFFLVWGLVRNSEETVRASLVGFVLLALITPVAFYTGEPAEEIVEHLPGVSRSVIHEHEEAAEIAWISMAALGALSILSLAVRRGARASARWPNYLVLAAALLSAAIFARTAYLGGEIRHTEVRPGAVVPAEEPEHD